MALDAICIAALMRELHGTLVGAKIDKVQQPARDMLILSVHSHTVGSTRLLASCGTGTARLHITQGSFENPQSPPMFCMLLRKHMVGAHIENIYQPDFERMLVFDLNAFDEMGMPVKKQLVLEMMGRNSNIILVGPEGHIIDCLRRVDSDMSISRQVLPGLIYRLPPKQEKPIFLSMTEGEIRASFAEKNNEKLSDKWLLDSFSALSPLICREISYRACGEVSKPLAEFSDEQEEKLLTELFALHALTRSEAFFPSMLIKDELPQDFSFMSISQYENAMKIQEFSDFSTLLDSFFTLRDQREMQRRKAQNLQKSTKSAHDRALRKLSARREELLKAENREILRKRGDLVTANLYRMKKGDHLLECEDYYEDGSPLIKIPLDPLKTPQQNAARFYRDYNKAKTAETYLCDLIEKGEREVDYLASVLDAVSRTENERDLAEIRRELTETGFLRAQKNAKKEKIKQNAPMRFLSTTGMEILVGKNNTQNDLLTTKLARRTDIWLHIQKLHGSHVIISCNDAVPDEQTLSEAAGLAAFFSQGRDSGKLPVDYTQVRYVKKPSGSMPGAVIYTDYKTIIASPNERLAEKLKA